MGTEETRALVQRLYASYSSGDAEAFATMIHDDIDWIIFGPIDVFPFEGARRGKAAVLEAIALMARDYQLKRHVPEVVIADGDRAAVMLNAAFVQRHTGRTLSFRLANLLRFQEGRVIEFREFSDTFDVTQQALGRWLEV